MILAITIPIWIVPVLLWKKKWIEFEKHRIDSQLENPIADYKDVPWFKMGVVAGVVAWLMFGLFFNLLNSENIQMRFSYWIIDFISCLPVFLICGFLWAAIMKFWLGLRPGGPCN